MTYPLPENMGFPLPRTIGEMLPDETLVEPEGQHGRYGKGIHVSVMEYTCAACGKRFTSTSQHRYKAEISRHGKSKRVQYYCSYTCYRPIERAAQEKFKKETMGFAPENSKSKSPVERARARVEKCKAKLEEYQAIRNDPQAWNALPTLKKHNLTKMISRWKSEVDKANEMLKEAELYEPD